MGLELLLLAFGGAMYFGGPALGGLLASIGVPSVVTTVLTSAAPAVVKKVAKVLIPNIGQPMTAAEHANGKRHNDAVRADPFSAFT